MCKAQVKVSAARLSHAASATRIAAAVTPRHAVARIVQATLSGAATTAAAADRYAGRAMSGATGSPIGSGQT